MKGYRFCQVRCARESRANALLVIQRYPFVLEGSAKEAPEGVSFTLDLAALPAGDGMAAEEMICREVQRAASLHAVTP